MKVDRVSLFIFSDILSCTLCRPSFELDNSEACVSPFHSRNVRNYDHIGAHVFVDGAIRLNVISFQ